MRKERAQREKPVMGLKKNDEGKTLGGLQGLDGTSDAIPASSEAPTVSQRIWPEILPHRVSYMTITTFTERAHFEQVPLR